jgi:hypothetical protein
MHVLDTVSAFLVKNRPDFVNEPYLVYEAANHADLVAVLNLPSVFDTMKADGIDPKQVIDAVWTNHEAYLAAAAFDPYLLGDRVVTSI